MINKCLLAFALFFLFPFFLEAQVTYQPVNKDGISFGSYGRIGVDWNFENGGSIGRRLNLNNMGSIGGRMEEQDYMELYPTFIFKPFNDDDPTIIRMQTRFAVYSQSLSLMGNSTTSSLGGLTFAVPEYYVEASNISGKDLTIWVGARLYRGYDIQPADHFYFDDHSGQGFGIGFKNTRFASIFVSSTDTSATHPPYFYINIGSGDPNVALRQRTVHILDHDFELSEKQKLTLMGEYHHMGKKNGPNDPEIEPYEDVPDTILNYPADYGLVIGAKLESVLGNKNDGAYNRLTVRYGTRLANGGDGGHSKTWMTFGAPDLDRVDYKGAYSLSIADDIYFNPGENNSVNAYLIYTRSKGAADTNGKAYSYLGKEVYNRKSDFTFGVRDIHYFTDKFHLMNELHYSTRKDGVDDRYAYTKLSIVPTFVPTGKRDMWARPQFRFVCSLAHYNNAAKNNLYSPYLQYVGPQQWGYYFGVKAEWWI